MGLLFYVGVIGALYCLYQLYCLALARPEDFTSGQESTRKPASLPEKALSKPAALIKQKLNIKSSSKEPVILVSADQVWTMAL